MAISWTTFILLAVSGLAIASFDNIVFFNGDTDILHPAAQNEDKAYCFQFTWLGGMDNSTFGPYLNKSCSDRFAMTRPMPLCVNPMVVTPDASPPNITKMYMDKFEKVSCSLNDGSVCAKFSYIFNGAVQNVTRYCTKVTVDDVPMTSGCVTDSRGAYTTEVCACRSRKGDYPCNGAFYFAPNFTVAIALNLFLFFFRWFSVT